MIVEVLCHVGWQTRPSGWEDGRRRLFAVITLRRPMGDYGVLVQHTVPRLAIISLGAITLPSVMIQQRSLYLLYSLVTNFII